MRSASGSGTVPEGPTLAATLRGVATPRDEIRQARLAQGLSQEEVARRAGVSVKTVGRIERGEDYKDPRSLPAIRAVLGLDTSGGLDLSQVPASELAAEVVRRLMEAEAILQHSRFTSGEVPPEVLHKRSTIAGPPADETRGRSRSGG